MELVVLGAGPAYTDKPGALGSANLVMADGAAIVLDLGMGAYPSLASRVDPSEILGVIVTHLHPDHYIDLVPLRHYLRWEFNPPRRARVLGPAETGIRLDALHASPCWSLESLDIEQLGEGTRRIGPFEIESRRVEHTEESYAVRVSVPGDGPAAPGLVYSGDCGRTEDLAPLIRPGDTLLVEVSFGVGPNVPGAHHLDAGMVGELCATTAPASVLLTHILDWRRADETVAVVRSRFDGPVRFVWPGDCATV